MSGSPVLQVEALSVRYADQLALDAVTFDLLAGDYVAIIGPNGAGKSTLMQAIMGLIPQYTGQINVDAKRLGYVPQHQAVDWSFPVTVRDVVMMGLARRIGWFRWASKQHKQQVDEALERVNLSALAMRQIGELSGGQQQRVFIARALVQKTDILLLDEPFAGVDVAAQSGLMTIINSLNREDGITILLTTHDLSLAFQHFHKVMALNMRLLAFGNPAEIYTPPILRELYGGSVVTLSAEDGQQALVFVDEATCCGDP